MIAKSCLQPHCTLDKRNLFSPAGAMVAAPRSAVEGAKRHSAGRKHLACRSYCARGAITASRPREQSAKSCVKRRPLIGRLNERKQVLERNVNDAGSTTRSPIYHGNRSKTVFDVRPWVRRRA